MGGTAGFDALRNEVFAVLAPTTPQGRSQLTAIPSPARATRAVPC